MRCLRVGGVQRICVLPSVSTMPVNMMGESLRISYRRSVLLSMCSRKCYDCDSLNMDMSSSGGSCRAFAKRCPECSAIQPPGSRAINWHQPSHIWGLQLATQGGQAFQCRDLVLDFQCPLIHSLFITHNSKYALSILTKRAWSCIHNELLRRPLVPPLDLFTNALQVQPQQTFIPTRPIVHCILLLTQWRVIILLQTTAS